MDIEPLKVHREQEQAPGNRYILECFQVNPWRLSDICSVSMKSIILRLTTLFLPVILYVDYSLAATDASAHLLSSSDKELPSTNVSKSKRMYQPPEGPDPPPIFLPNTIIHWVATNSRINYAWYQWRGWHRWFQGAMGFSWQHRGVNVLYDRPAFVGDQNLRVDIAVRGRTGQPSSLIKLFFYNLETPIAAYCRSLNDFFEKFTDPGIERDQFTDYPNLGAWVVGIARNEDIVNGMRRRYHRLAEEELGGVFMGLPGCNGFRHDSVPNRGNGRERYVVSSRVLNPPARDG